jgi:ribonuclease P protein component
VVRPSSAPVVPKAALVSLSDAMKPAGLPRPQRLADAVRFKAALSVRPVIRGDLFDVFRLGQSQASQPARIGLVVPKRVCRLAVHRNQVKRAIRESFRRSAASLSGYDWVVRLRRAPGSDRRPLQPELDRHWLALAGRAAT